MKRITARISLFILFSLALVAALIVNACSGSQVATLKPLKIGITTWPGFDVVLYAKTAGIFKQRGLDVELIRFENQQDSTRAMLKGSLDAAFASLWDVVQADSTDDKPAIILVTNISAGADGIVARPEIKSVKDLKGKRVGAKLGTVNHLILLEALKLHKLEPKSVPIEDVSNEISAQMIEQGKLDAAVLWQPLLGDTAKKIKGNIVYTTQEIDSLVIDTLVSRSELVKTKQAEFTNFLQAWFDVMHAVETKPQDVFAQVGQEIGQSGEAFGQDYAGLKKGDLSMEKRMFQSDERLKSAMQELSALLKADPRHGKSPRQDIEISTDLMTAAIEGWKP